MWFIGKLFIAISLINLIAGHEDDVHTIQLNKDNFNDEITNSNFFIMFFAPWCGHCQRLAPTWEQLAELLNNEEGTRVKIGKVDCTTDNELCSQQDVTGYPTLLFFKIGESEKVKFRGTRDLPSLTAFINQQLGDNNLDDDTDNDIEVPKPVQAVVELTDETFNKHVASGKHFIKFYAPWCGHCQRLAPTWDDLGKSLEHDTSITIAKIDCTQYRPICQDFEVKGYPTLLWIEDGKKVDKYSGARGHEELKAYVEKMAGSPSNENEEETAEDVPEPPVIQLIGNDFKHGTEKGVTFVKFFAPWCGHCKRLAPTWEELALKFVGRSDIKIAKVDCTLADNKDLCATEEVDGFPTLFIYKNGEKISEYNGSRSLEDLFDFVTRHSSSHDEL